MACILAGAAACGGTTFVDSDGGDVPRDGGATKEDARGPSTGDSGDWIGRDGGATTTCDPGNIPSGRSVKITVTNEAASDRYIVTAGSFCDPFSVSLSHQAPLPLHLGFQCVCECPNPGGPRPSALRRLAPGESYSFTWDATSLVTCTESVDCATRGWPNMPPASEIVGGTKPVGAGSYSLTVATLRAVPQGCSGDGTTFGCSGGPGFGTPPSAIQTMCATDVAATGAFTLASNGDTSVVIPIVQ